jgi:hypothetical protein
MLENGTTEAKLFSDQLDKSRVTSWKCPCGCASINFAIDGRQPASGAMQILADFLVGDDYGIFLFAQNGTLSGLEVYACAKDAPKALPEPEDLRVLS